MFRKALLFGGTLLLAGAAVLVTPGLGQAQHGGGGHGGGHGGGGFRGGHVGGAGIGETHFGGYRGGFHRGGSYGHPYSHYGDRRYYGGYGFYPYSYGGYDSYDPYSYASPGVTDDSGYNGSYGDMTQYYTPTTDTSARISVKVPAGARVSFDGTPTSSMGSVREFTSPPLTPNSRYTYQVQARWDENGREVTQTQQVEVRAGGHTDVSFPVPPGDASQTR
jgi:uncharacterized protein (TIGR03000 family)